MANAIATVPSIDGMGRPAKRGEASQKTCLIGQ